ncbi:hypothetical protein CC2G_012449 [Coprinopsis cinerea AmutBmut pab1-1]|nr:hypothetical protein CC2G_012449 [Coprinopsis cinerea AmutBmut pab1-1]
MAGCEGLYDRVLKTMVLDVAPNRSITPYDASKPLTTANIIAWCAGVGLTTRDIDDCALFAQVFLRQVIDSTQFISDTHPAVQAAIWVHQWMDRVVGKPIDNPEWYRPKGIVDMYDKARTARFEGKPANTPIYTTSNGVQVLPNALLPKECPTVEEVIKTHVDDVFLASIEPTMDVDAPSAQ